MAVETEAMESSRPSIASDKLSVGTKLAYGAGDLGTAIVAALKVYFLLYFFTDVARLNPAAAGTILLLLKFWDAVNDPFVGWLSDRTVTRWGRRRPWIAAGAIPFGLTFFLLWLVPDWSDTWKFVYYVLVAALGDTMYTVVNVPYAALTPELSRDYDERTSLNSYRFAFSIIGALLAAVVHPLIVGRFADVQTGYMVSAAVWSIAATIPCFIVVAGTRENPNAVPEIEPGERMGLLKQLRIVFSNVPYRFVITLYLLSWLVLQMVATVLAYYMTYYMGRPGQLPLVLLAIQGSTFFFLFVWNLASRRLEKRTVYSIGASIWLVVQIALYFLTPDQFRLIYPLGILAGAGLGVAYLIPWSMMPDVIEFDEWETGQRREGIFYGFMVFLQKAGLAAGLWVVGMVLAWSGYITPTDEVPVPVQPESALNAIRLFIGPIPVVLLLASLVLVYFYPITRSKHAEIRAALARRNLEPS